MSSAGLFIVFRVVLHVLEGSPEVSNRLHSFAHKPFSLHTSVWGGGFVGQVLLLSPTLLRCSDMSVDVSSSPQQSNFDIIVSISTQRLYLQLKTSLDDHPHHIYMTAVKC